MLLTSQVALIESRNCRGNVIGGARLAVLVPGGMPEAMKLAFDWVAGDLPTWEKGQSGPWKITAVYELRCLHLWRVGSRRALVSLMDNGGQHAAEDLSSRFDVLRVSFGL